MKHVAEIKRVESAGDADRVELILLDRYPPGAAPGQRAEPHLPLILVRWTRLHCEPWVGLVTGCAAPAFKDPLAWVERLLGQVPLARPAAGEVIQRIVRRRQRPCCSSRLFDRDRLRFAVFDGRGTSQDPACCINRIVQRYVYFTSDILKRHFKTIRFDGVTLVVQHQVAIAVSEGDLQGRFDKEP